MKKYYQRDALVFTSNTPISEVKTFIKEHPVFVKKIGKSSLGKGVSKVDLSEGVYQGKHSIEQLVRKWLSEGEDLLLEELVVQSHFMSEFNPSSVNTIRVISFLTKSGIITPYAFFKTGKAGSFVDNGGAGGILIGIDSKTGELITDGIDEKRNIYVAHPDTGKRYKGAILPDWSQAIDLCKKMALELPSVKMVGWDLAHTEKGWILIEANERSQIVGPQLIFNRGLRQELTEIMNQMDLYIPY